MNESLATMASPHRSQENECASIRNADRGGAPQRAVPVLGNCPAEERGLLLLAQRWGNARPQNDRLGVRVAAGNTLQCRSKNGRAFQLLLSL